MREVSQTEAIQTLPALLKEAQTQPIRVAGEDGNLAFLISPLAYKDVRQAALQRMHSISQQAGAKFDAHATELGISSEELLEQLLAD